MQLTILWGIVLYSSVVVLCEQVNCGLDNRLFKTITAK